ncbi:MAG: glycosyltransferase family 2 protein [Hydrotalea sp.]|nr:glycosyltransferase family 2 protein [Hydrotalea sp.]
MTKASLPSSARNARRKAGKKILSVIVPVYENAGSLTDLFAALKDVEKKIAADDVGLELLFVNDGSQDNSLEKLLSFKKTRPATKIIDLSRNFGEMAATKEASKFVTGDCFLSLAADLQDPPQLIVEMVEWWLRGERYVIAVRRSRQDPFISKLLSGFYYWLLRMLVVKNFPKGGFDMALMDKVFLPFFQQGSKSFFAAILSHWLGFTPKVIYYDRVARKYGKSKWTFGKKLIAFLDIFLGYSAKPIRLMSLLGLLVAAASFGFGIYAVVDRFSGAQVVPGYASLFAMVAFLLGLVILMLGIIGEYIWRVFDETNKRPSAVIKDFYE